MPTSDLIAPAADTGRLLEEVASESNLATALLNVARNKGAPGVDGQSVVEVVEFAPLLLPRLRRALLEGDYGPGDIRRVWIPKPGGGQRGLGIPNVIDRMVQEAQARRLVGHHSPAVDHEDDSLALADLIVLDKDPLSCDPAELSFIQPVATMVGGEWVWQS